MRSDSNSKQEKRDVEKPAHTEEDEEYGCCGCHPSPLQCMNNIKSYVFWLCIFNFWEGFIVNGVINVVLVALETRFSLSSTKSGLIASANDFGAFIFLVLVGYFGEKRHKPRLMTWGIVIMAVGCFVFTTPHIFGGEYQFSGSDGPDNSSLCLPDRDLSGCGQSSKNEDSKFYPLFLIGQILLGIGAAPLFTIGLTYIDENTEVEMTSLYTGMTTCAAAIGVAVGYVVGGQSLAIFVDFDSGADGSPLESDSPQWVGAWWLGSVIACVMLLLVAIPILGFPKRLPGYEDLLKKRKSEAHNDGAENATAKPDFGTTIRDFPKALYLLIKNPTFLCTCLGGTCDALIVGGTATFGAKLLQQLHNVELTTAGWIMGAITVPGSGGGMILGGYLVQRFRLKCRGILRLCALFAALSLLFSPSWLAKCESVKLAGIQTPYDPNSPDNLTDTPLISACNQNCNCGTGKLDPLCAVDSSIVYFSPCHAGCGAYNVSTKEYSECSCFDHIAIKLDDGLTVSDAMNLKATVGDCSSPCPWIYVFCVLFFFIMLCTFATISPNITAVFRCVPYSQRSLAIGFELLFIRLLGTTPGPILFGYVIDSTCVIWEDDCGSKGSCWVYNKEDMGIRILYWWIALKVVSVLFYLLASIVYNAPEDDLPIADLVLEGNDDSKKTMETGHATTDKSYANSGMEVSTIAGNGVNHKTQMYAGIDDVQKAPLPSDEHAQKDMSPEEKNMDKAEGNDSRTHTDMNTHTDDVQTGFHPAVMETFSNDSKDKKVEDTLDGGDGKIMFTHL